MGSRDQRFLKSYGGSERAKRLRERAFFLRGVRDEAVSDINKSQSVSLEQLAKVEQR